MPDLVAYQCPVHKNFRTLCVDSGPESGGTRFATGKCCPRQYAVEWSRWRLRGKECRELIEELECIMEQEDA